MKGKEKEGKKRKRNDKVSWTLGGHSYTPHVRGMERPLPWPLPSSLMPHQAQSIFRWCPFPQLLASCSATSSAHRAQLPLSVPCSSRWGRHHHERGSGLACPWGPHRACTMGTAPLLPRVGMAGKDRCLGCLGNRRATVVWPRWQTGESTVLLYEGVSWAFTFFTQLTKPFSRRKMSKKCNHFKVSFASNSLKPTAKGFLKIHIFKANIIANDYSVIWINCFWVFLE